MGLHELWMKVTVKYLRRSVTRQGKIDRAVKKRRAPSQLARAREPKMSATARKMSACEPKTPKTSATTGKTSASPGHAADVPPNSAMQMSTAKMVHNSEDRTQDLLAQTSTD